MAARRSAKDVFGDAVEVAPDRRDEFLRAVCGDDAALREEVESLLSIHDLSSGFLGAPTQCREGEVWRNGDAIEEGSALPSEGAAIGRYRIGPLLGEGGFGVVLAAEQTSPLRRPVALKIIKLGMDTRRVIARFETERQTLALMDHPHIAKVLDAGATDAGRPYFVMELVSGDPITVYCDRRGLPLRDRLGVFLQVCSAVQHAHQKGVIHRDLKPANILVSEQDGRPCVKVVDFGIAKAMTGPTGSTQTEHRHPLGTPEYMSPEQAAGSPDVDTRVDVYALGGLLYELLTGSTPFDRDRLRAASPVQIERILMDEQPPRPSTRTGGLGNERDAARSLRGDLDWIVMRCLEKDRNRRYETVNALAVDIERFLRSEPVSARPPSPLYTLRKLVRRRRTAFQAGAAVAAALLLGVAAATDSSIRAKRQNARAEAVGAFLRDTLRLADPAQTRGEDWDVSDLLGQAVQRLDAGALSGQPLAEADVRATIGETYLGLARHDEAKAQLDIAESILADRRGANHPETLRVCGLRLRLLVNRGEYPEAKSLSAALLPDLRRVLGDRHPDVYRAIALRSTALLRLGDFAGAAACGREALAGLRLTLGEHPDTADAMGVLGMAYVWLGHPAKAEQLGREAVDINTRHLGLEHPRTLQMTALYGLALSKQGNFEEGERWERFTLDTRRRVLGPDHDFTLRTMSNLSDTMLRAGRLDDAEKLGREAYERLKRKAGPGNAHTLATQRSLASVLIAQERYADAVELLRDVLANAERELGPLHTETIYARRGLGRALCLVGNFEDGEACLNEALRVGLEVQGPDNVQTFATYSWLGKCMLEQGRHDKAVALATIAVDGFHRQNQRTGDAWSAELYLARALRAVGKPREELAVLKNLVELYSNLSVSSRTYNKVLYGERLIDLGYPDEAETQLMEARALLHGSAGANAERLRRIEELLTRVREARRNPSAGLGTSVIAPPTR